MLVIGGYNSANTTRWRLSAATITHGPTTSKRRLRSIPLVRCAVTVGVTAGASTPHWIIEEVQGKVQTIVYMMGNNLFYPFRYAIVGSHGGSA